MIMAEKTNEIDRVYTINLRRAWLNHPRAKRTKKSIRTIREFVMKHSKTAEVKLSKGINELIMSRGFKKPPGKISIEVKGDFAQVQAKLPGEIIVKKTEDKKGGITGLRDRLAGKESVSKEEIKKAVEEKVAEETTEEKVKEIVKKVEEREKKTEAKKEAPKKEVKKETPKEELKKEEPKKKEEKASEISKDDSKLKEKSSNEEAK